MFQIPEQSVSSHHCEILLRGAEVAVKDLDSTNGTYIDGDAIKEAVLKPGQILRLGKVELKLDDGTPIPAAASAAPAKKKIDHTTAMPQGVKLNDFEPGSHPIKVAAEFKKKTNVINKYFIAGFVVLGIVVVVVMVMQILKTPGTPVQ
jgi:pSer/pThr/pTyr-binding forkhead associated (FHA) protein